MATIEWSDEQVEAAARVLSDVGSPWGRGDRLLVAHQMLTAAAQEQPAYDPTSGCDERCRPPKFHDHTQPAPEADEREALPVGPHRTNGFPVEACMVDGLPWPCPAEAEWRSVAPADGDLNALMVALAAPDGGDYDGRARQAARVWAAGFRRSQPAPRTAGN